MDMSINDGEIDLPCDGEHYDYERKLEVKEI